MHSPEQIKLWSIVKRLEATCAPQSEVDAAYDKYWEQTDKERAIAERLSKSFRELLAKEAAIARGKQNADN